MRGTNVCYHHGGRSRRSFAHPNFKHGFYCKVRPFLLLVAFAAYRRKREDQQTAAILGELAATQPHRTRAENRRFNAVYWAAIARLPAVKLTPELAAHVLRWWSDQL
jgi:hypothetical protein